MVPCYWLKGSFSDFDSIFSNFFGANFGGFCLFSACLGVCRFGNYAFALCTLVRYTLASGSEVDFLVRNLLLFRMELFPLRSDDRSTVEIGLNSPHGCVAAAVGAAVLTEWLRLSGL